jgi:hypothetical protein
MRHPFDKGIGIGHMVDMVVRYNDTVKGKRVLPVFHRMDKRAWAWIDMDVGDGRVYPETPCPADLFYQVHPASACAKEKDVRPDGGNPCHRRGMAAHRVRMIRDGLASPTAFIREELRTRSARCVSP